MKEESFFKAVESHIKKKYVLKKDAAKAWNLTPSYLCLILQGKRPPNGLMLKELGYRRVVKTNVEYFKRGDDE